jgi:hypothetical protein
MTKWHGTMGSLVLFLVHEIYSIMQNQTFQTFLPPPSHFGLCFSFSGSFQAQINWFQLAIVYKTHL